jgi:hypothetical protein
MENQKEIKAVDIVSEADKKSEIVDSILELSKLYNKKLSELDFNKLQVNIFNNDLNDLYKFLAKMFVTLIPVLNGKQIVKIPNNQEVEKAYINVFRTGTRYGEEQFIDESKQTSKTNYNQFVVGKGIGFLNRYSSRAKYYNDINEREDCEKLITFIFNFDETKLAKYLTGQVKSIIQKKLDLYKQFRDILIKNRNVFDFNQTKDEDYDNSKIICKKDLPNIKMLSFYTNYNNSFSLREITITCIRILEKGQLDISYNYTINKQTEKESITIPDFNRKDSLKSSFEDLNLKTLARLNLLYNLKEDVYDLAKECNESSKGIIESIKLVKEEITQAFKTNLILNALDKGEW